MDLAKQQYSIRLQEGVGLLPSLQAPASAGSSIQGQTVKEVWVLKEFKKPYRFDEQQKAYLEAKLNIGQPTGRKVDPDVVLKEMRRARGKDGERLFGVLEFVTPQQVSSFFSRLAAKLRQQQVEVTPQDILAAERANVLSTLHVRHPIVVDHYDVCSFVGNKTEFKKTKVGMLQYFCQSLELEVPVPAVKRKAPYLALLEELVDSCPFRAKK